MQTFIALILVTACVAYVAWQLLCTVRTGSGKAGSCCSKGCDAAAPIPASTPAKPREQFIAADSLRRRK